MLHTFITANRDELIRRCRLKVAKRSSPHVTEDELQYGVPLFLKQLVGVLKHDEEEKAAKGGSIPGSPATHTYGAKEADRTGALHGTELYKRGYTVDQVVHDYGDLCQAITELAKQTKAPVTVDEFHTFNRLLDNSIASAVVAYGRYEKQKRSVKPDGGAEVMHERLGTLAEEQRVLLDTALKALDALKVGNIGVMGATGTLLEDSLLKLRELVERRLPEIRAETGMVGDAVAAGRGELKSARERS